MKNFACFITLMLLLFGAPALAKIDGAEAAAKNLSAVTVFMDVNKLNRKNLAAKKMTAMHQDFAQYGYRLVGISPYNENGDLEGFFISYQKK